MSKSGIPNRNAPMLVTVLLIVVAAALLVVAIVYFSEPAGRLPAFFPGHQAGSNHTHVKHGIGALVAAIVALFGAWLSSGRRRTTA